MSTLPKVSGGFTCWSLWNGLPQESRVKTEERCDLLPKTEPLNPKLTFANKNRVTTRLGSRFFPIDSGLGSSPSVIYGRIISTYYKSEI